MPALTPHVQMEELVLKTAPVPLVTDVPVLMVTLVTTVKHLVSLDDSSS